MFLSLPSTRGERFKDEREKKGKSLDEVAAETGLSKPTIWALEHDPDPMKNEQERDVGYLKVTELAKYYNVSVDYLLGLSPYRSPDTSIQGIEKVTGLHEEAIKRLQLLNDRESIFNQRLNFKAMEPINSLLEHRMLLKFILNIHEAKRYSEFQISNDAIGKDSTDAEQAAGRIGGIMLQQEDAIGYFRQEAISVLRDIVYDLVPEKEMAYGDNNKAGK